MADDQLLFKEVKCSVCLEIIPENQFLYIISVAKSDATLLEQEEVCENCMEEVRKALGYSITIKDTI